MMGQWSDPLSANDDPILWSGLEAYDINIACPRDDLLPDHLAAITATDKDGMWRSGSSALPS
jgi:hypothetical protein